MLSRMSAKVSIIIPSFNRQDLIKETLDSVINQTFQNWECIIVDDGSTDQTVEVLREYQRRDPRFKVIVRDRNPKGAAACRNIGVDNAEGDFIIFMDSDDLFIPECIEYRIKTIARHPEHSAWIFNTGVFKVQIGDRDVVWNRLVGEREDIVRFLDQDMPWHTSGPIWRKEDMFKFNEQAKSFQDWELHLRFLASGKKYYKDENEAITAYYRQDRSTKSISGSTYNKEQLANKIHIIYETCLAINQGPKKYDEHIVKMVFRAARQLKKFGLDEIAYDYWNKTRKNFYLSKLDGTVLTLFLKMLSPKNEMKLEYIMRNILFKGYLLDYKSTFLDLKQRDVIRKK